MTRKATEHIVSWAMPLGLLLFVAGLSLYESYSSREILGRWSYPYFAVLVLAALCWVALSVYVFRTERGSSGRGSVARRLFALATLFWGLAYLTGAIDSPEAAGRVLEGNLFGSSHPAAAILELIALWLVFVAAVVFVASKLPKSLQNTGLIIATVAVLLMVGETLVRGKTVLLPATQGFPTHSQALWHRRYVELNSLGFRDIEHSAEARGASRLLVVGDSYTFGVGVKEIEGRFGEITAELLSEVDGEPWESINAGLGDTHTLQHIEFLERMVAFGPDVVVLLYVFNDMDYVSPITKRSSILGRQGWQRVFNPGRILFQNSYFFQALYVRLRKISYMRDPVPVESTPYFDDGLLQRHLADIERFVGIAREAGASVLIVPYNLNIDFDEQSKKQYRHFFEAAGSQGLPLCSLETAFAGESLSGLVVNSLDGHPNVIANRLAAARGAKCIRERLGGEVGS